MVWNSPEGANIFSRKSLLFRQFLRELPRLQYEHLVDIDAYGTKVAPFVQTLAFLEVSDRCQDVVRGEGEYLSDFERRKAASSELMRIRVSAEDMRELLKEELEELESELTDPEVMALQKQLDAAQINASVSRQREELVHSPTDNQLAPEERRGSAPAALDISNRTRPHDVVQTEKTPRRESAPPVLQSKDLSWLNNSNQLAKTKKARRNSAPINLGFLARNVIRGSLNASPPFRAHASTENLRLDEETLGPVHENEDDETLYDGDDEKFADE
jgi:hypothetical protein